MLQATAPAEDTVVPPPAAQASAGSLWDDLGGLNLSAYDDCNCDESDVVGVEGLVTQLCTQWDGTDSVLTVLQQLASPQTPPYVILGCDQWPQLAQLLPQLLSSSDLQVAAAAEELLQQQLAPELLHCSPEPLAQLLTVLLLPPAPQQGHLQMTPSQPAAAGAPSAAEALQCVYSVSVLQFMTAGLQKLGRQWHFLDEPLAATLCTAVMTLVLRALQQDLAAAAAAQVQTNQQAQPFCSSSHEHQQQQRPSQQPLALDLLLADHDLAWWHRLHANSASSTTCKAAAQQQGLVQHVLTWAPHCCPDRASGAWHPTPADTQQQAVSGLQGLKAPGTLPASNSSSSCCDTTVLSDALGLVSGSSSGDGRRSSSPVLLQHCLAVHCLSVLVATHSGRQLLQAVAAPSSSLQQQQATGAQDSTFVPQAPSAATQGGGSSSGGATTAGPLRACCDCLQLWASLQAAQAQQQQETHNQQQQQQQPGHPPSNTLPFPPGAPARHAAARASFMPGAHSAHQPSCSAAVDAAAVDAVVAAAAATAAWALRAFDEQRPWFGNNP